MPARCISASSSESAASKAGSCSTGDDAHAVAPDQAAIVELDAAGDDVEQARLAGAVAADEADPLAGQQGEGCAIEQRMRAEGEAAFDQAEENAHGCNSGRGWKK